MISLKDLMKKCDAAMPGVKTADFKTTERFALACKEFDETANPETVRELCLALQKARETLERIKDGKDGCYGMIIADMGYSHFAKHTCERALEELRKVICE